MQSRLYPVPFFPTPSLHFFTQILSLTTLLVVKIEKIAVLRRCPCDNKHAQERRCAPVKKCNALVELCFLEVAVKNCGANDGREGEEDELDWNNYLRRAVVVLRSHGTHK